ncbi:MULTISPECIES: murein transglycosylase domain-containing protein [unclassified Endozoicomonas]|uniref:transglycosylase SLT domain-containing protein n=1 Tax=unclassified Endozoicomonas TaxID=2644528 RepID=UPI003BB57917
MKYTNHYRTRVFVDFDSGKVHVETLDRTESSFNPYAVSSSNAYGLMQIIPKTAGRDVFDKVKKLPGQPSKNWLFQPNNNIDTGTAYLSLLENHYLKQIRDPLSRKYTIISAYNGGAGNVFATFDRNSRDRAIQKINGLKPNQVYWALTQKHPRGESRRYLEKVSTAQKDFYQGNI